MHTGYEVKMTVWPVVRNIAVKVGDQVILSFSENNRALQAGPAQLCPGLFESHAALAGAYLCAGICVEK
jgi:hypothetical protein